MPDDLKPASPAEIAEALAHALMFDGKRRFRAGDAMMADITAAHLMAHLERCGFVLMRKAPSEPHRDPRFT